MPDFIGGDLLKQLEGCRLQAYQDGAGVWTIGFGHTAGVHAGMCWTQAQAEATLDADVARYVAGVRQLVGNAPLTDAQFSALVIFAFNVGLTALAGSTALRLLRAGHLDAVPDALCLWNKIHDRSGVAVVCPGLVARRAAEAELWRSTCT